MTAGQAARARIAAGLWQVDASSSTARFSVRNFGIRRVHGSLTVTSGSVDVGADGVPRSVVAAVSAASVATSNRRRDTDLRGRRFLDVEHAPEMTFTATGVTTADDGWSVVGVLTVRGVPAPLTLTALTASLDERMARVEAHGVLDLGATPVRAPRFLVGRVVDITVDATLRRLPTSG